jgi:quinol monooxygenase YgiN
MYGMVGEVWIDQARRDEAERMLHDMIIPSVKAEPGFVAAYWFRSIDGRTGKSFVVFESEEAARKAAENRPRPPADAPVAVVRFEFLPVLAQA